MTTTSPRPGPAPEDLEQPCSPERTARPWVVTTMALAQLGLFLALLTPVFASLAIKVQEIVPKDDEVSALGMVSSLGAVAAFLANPVFGRISDRTTGRFGRRRSWLVIGALGLTGGLAVIATTRSLTVVAVAWFLSQMFANAALAAFTASVADQVPVFQRGKVAGLIGVMQNVAILGAAYAAKVLGTHGMLLFMAPAAVGLALVLLYAIALPDKPLPQRPPSGGGPRTVLRTFWVNPRKHPDFGWAFTSRFMIILAMFMFTTFRLLFLQDQLGLSDERAVSVMATGVLIYTLVLMASGQLAGWLSDRLRRRKVFVGSSALVFGIGTALLITTHSVAGFYAAEVVLGLGFGVYAGVDLALVLDVLPDPEETAKDLGVFNIANAAPQSIAPALGVLLVNTAGGHEYHLLLGAAAAVCVIGALAVIPIRSVR
ncbi:MFS transporter [Streptomyces sp. NPDC059862]|uniref:MFS transporter n=1 Tax=Streptomyces sp. NPDC059862 TaxID=3346975 RepID=UPI00364B2EC8